MRLTALVAAGSALALGAIAFATRDGAPEIVVADERAGLLRGVRFGDSAADVRSLLGEPSDAEPGFFPAGADYTGPPAIRAPRSDPRPPQALHYDDTAYLVSPAVGVFSMATLAAGAVTRAGRGVGDDLAPARAAYRRVTCGEAAAGESLLGGDSSYRWCRAIVGRIRVFFGGDPIESITLTRLR